MARTLREWVVRTWATLRRRRTDADLEEELRTHLALAAEEAQRRGQGLIEADRAARLRAGGVSQAMDALRDQRGLPWVDAAISGVGNLPRLVLRHRGYFAFATVTLAAAVGVNLVVFTVVNALWLRPSPIPDSDRLVALPDGAFVTEAAPSLEIFRGGVAGQVMTNDVFGLQFLQPQISFDQIGRELETLPVTPGYFRLFRLGIHGRDFAAGDNLAGAEPVAIISDRLWSREFGRREDVIGAVIPAKPVPIRVIGVAAPGFEGARRGEKADMWIPCGLLPRVVAGKAEESNPLMIFARLGPGQTLADVDRLVREKHADGPIQAYLRAVPLKDVFGTPESRTILINERSSLGIVSGLAMLVLLGGCATLAALVLVHYERRRGELAVRLALGASRARLTAELCRELLLIAATGTLGALLVVTWGLHVIPSLSLPGGVDLGRLDLSLDWRVVGAATATTLLTLVAAAWLPINRSTRTSLAKDLVTGPAPTPSSSSQRIRQVFLAVHVSATVVVLVAAGLFVRAVIYGFGSGPGFDVHRTLFVDVTLWSPGELPPDRQGAAAQATTRIDEALGSLPGVDQAAEGMPPIGFDATQRVAKPVAVTTHGERRSVTLGTLDGTPNLLSTLGVPIVAGRALTQADAAAQPVPVIMTASLARMLWPAGDALGQVVSPVWRGGRLLIVGIARDFAYGSLAKPAAGVVVTARGMFRGINCSFIVRAEHPETMVEPIRRVLKATVPDAPMVKVTTGRDIIARDLGRQRLGAWFFSGFGLAALLLGVGGVFGLVAYLAESRQREYGLRLALGATSRDLAHIGLRAALVPVSIGLAAGLVVAGCVSRVFTSLLTGLGALDLLTYAGVGLTMVSCAALAALGAAWRLRRLNPSEALRAS
jgi:predicted permease